MFFWYSLAFSMIQRMLAIWSPVPLPFLKPAWTSGSSRFIYCWSLAWRILSITDWGSDHERLIANFRLKLKKVGKTTSPFRYDLNQIPYNYTMEVTNRFKGLDLLECLKNWGQRFSFNTHHQLMPPLLTLVLKRKQQQQTCNFLEESLTDTKH